MTFGAITQGSFTSAAGSEHILTNIGTATVMQLIANVGSMDDGHIGEFRTKWYVVSGDTQARGQTFPMAHKQIEPVVQLVPFPTDVGTATFTYDCTSGVAQISWKVFGLV